MGDIKMTNIGIFGIRWSKSKDQTSKLPMLVWSDIKITKVGKSDIKNWSDPTSKIGLIRHQE